MTPVASLELPWEDNTEPREFGGVIPVRSRRKTVDGRSGAGYNLDIAYCIFGGGNLPTLKPKIRFHFSTCASTTVLGRVVPSATLCADWRAVALSASCHN